MHKGHLSILVKNWSVKVEFFVISGSKDWRGDGSFQYLQHKNEKNNSEMKLLIRSLVWEEPNVGAMAEISLHTLAPR